MNTPTSSKTSGSQLTSGQHASVPAQSAHQRDITTHSPLKIESHIKKSGPTAVKINSIIFLCFFIIIIVYLLFQYISVRLAYKPLYDWWSQNGGKQYDKLFSITNIVAAKQSALLFYISNYIFTPPLSQATIGGMNFLLKEILPKATYIDTDAGNAFQGVVTPRSLCVSVLPKENTGDLDFDEWIKTGKRGGHPVNADMEGYLQYQSLPSAVVSAKDPKPMSGYTVTSYVLNKACVNNKNQVPIWPAPTDTGSWTGLIYEWLNGYIDMSAETTTPDPTTHPIAAKIRWYATLDTTDNHLEFIQNTSLKHAPPPDTAYDIWFGPTPTNKNPISKPPADNWMARMGVKVNSALVLGFLNDTYSIGGVTMNHQAFVDLQTATGGVAGGWMGFIRGKPNSSDDYTNMLESTVEFHPPPSIPQCKHNTLGTISAGAGPIFSALGMAAMTPFPFNIIVGLGGLIMGGIGAAQSATSCT